MQLFLRVPLPLNRKLERLARSEDRTRPVMALRMLAERIEQLETERKSA